MDKKMVEAVAAALRESQALHFDDEAERRAAEFIAMAHAMRPVTREAPSANTTAAAPSEHGHGRGARGH